MEFASELIVRASLAGLSIIEVPTTLSKDCRSRPPHLRSWRDVWRHLRFLLIYSPRWLFLYPGIVVMDDRPRLHGRVDDRAHRGRLPGLRRGDHDLRRLARHPPVPGGALLLVTRYHATQRGLLPASRSITDLADRWTLGRGLSWVP